MAGSGLWLRTKLIDSQDISLATFVDRN
jgi:hypothetical protein